MPTGATVASALDFPKPFFLAISSGEKRPPSIIALHFAKTAAEREVVDLINPSESELGGYWTPVLKALLSCMENFLLVISPLSILIRRDCLWLVACRA